MASQTEKPLTVAEAAAFLGISKHTVYRLVQRRNLPHFKPTGKTLYFYPSDLNAWVQARPIKTREEINRAAGDFIRDGTHTTREVGPNVWKRILKSNKGDQ